MCWTCDEYDNRHRKERKDFRHTKAGPEVPKHRKKGGKPRVRKKDDHKHIYVKERRELAPWYSDELYIYDVWACAEFNCDKEKKRRFVGRVVR